MAEPTKDYDDGLRPEDASVARRAPPGRGGVKAQCFAFSSLLPAATERLIDLDQRELLVELRLSEIQLRRKIICFAGQHLQITGAALLIEHQGEVVGPLRGLSEQLLLTAKLTIFLKSDQRIRNLLERVLNGLLIRKH